MRGLARTILYSEVSLNIRMLTGIDGFASLSLFVLINTWFGFFEIGDRGFDAGYASAKNIQDD